MYREQIEQWFEDHREEMVKDIMDLVAIPSVDGEARPGKPYGEGPVSYTHLPLDAFKGLCRANGGMVMIDSDTCPQFAAAPKCRNCVHFCEPNEEEIGICKGLEKEYWAYADLNAKKMCIRDR